MKQTSCLKLIKGLWLDMVISTTVCLRWILTMFPSGLNNVDLSNGQFFPVYKFSWFFPLPCSKLFYHKKTNKKIGLFVQKQGCFCVIKNSFEQGNGINLGQLINWEELANTKKICLFQTPTLQQMSALLGISTKSAERLMQQKLHQIRAAPIPCTQGLLLFHILYCRMFWFFSMTHSSKLDNAKFLFMVVCFFY